MDSRGQSLSWYRLGEMRGCGIVPHPLKIYASVHFRHILIFSINGKVNHLCKFTQIFSPFKRLSSKLIGYIRKSLDHFCGEIFNDFTPARDLFRECVINTIDHYFVDDPLLHVSILEQVKDNSSADSGYANHGVGIFFDVQNRTTGHLFISFSLDRGSDFHCGLLLVKLRHRFELQIGVVRQGSLTQLSQRYISMRLC